MLEASAAKGCHLCKLFLRALMKSERPDGDQHLPDRPVYLSFGRADFAGRGTRIDVRIEPESLETAGRPRISGDMAPGYSILPGAMKERTLATSRLTHIAGEEWFWIVDCEDGYEYFQGATEISAAAFWALVNPYYSTKVEIYGLRANTTSVLEKCSSIEDLSTGSAAGFHLALNWLRTCMTTHFPCRHFAPVLPNLPTRVIDIGQSDRRMAPRLHVSTTNQKGFYFTLSHRWGTSNHCRTTKSRLHEFQREIPLNELSKTFLDAIDITRRLGFRYLWIDSLCIIQDDESDWQTEAAKMGDVYRQGALNLAAVDSDEPGCFRDRDGAVTRPCKLDIEIPDGILPLRDGDIIHALPSQKLGPKKPSQAYRGPLDSRGWVLQEYMLARRTLNFGKKMIYWDCLTMLASEPLPDGLETGDIGINDDGDFVQRFKAGISGDFQKLEDPLSTASQAFSRIWFLAVEAYTRRKLTFEKDRLVAIAGLAIEYQKVTGDVYLAGMWKRDLLDGLLWSVWARGCPTVGNTVAQKGDHGPYGERYTDFKAPSWSWASVSGYIRYIEQYEHDDRVGQKFMADLLHAECTPLDPRMTSYTYSGHLLIRGQLLEATIQAMNPFSVDWDTQKNTGSMLQMLHYTREMEKLAALPLSTTIKPKEVQAGPSKRILPVEGEGGDTALPTSVEVDQRSDNAPDAKGKVVLSGMEELTDEQPVPHTPSATSAPFPRGPDYTRLTEGMLSAFAPGIDMDELRSAINIKANHVTIDVRAIKRAGERTLNKMP
ncbi:hypothetical protein AYL99_06633 [Fonsecaea erecta]|uniref:Heterokaryon incompatibility domain-containing protein n=1 Tax=Fonsecaea erecta TaxID=1367422 RepID=A0A178ZJX3_9EURO|nr:hypothetical protein AYL99_06633 [Fonsecaea erecta]OAP59335.1 hypothetical protein AYL99_06633 [Fonsecaea erecta]